MVVIPPTNPEPSESPTIFEVRPSLRSILAYIILAMVSAYAVFFLNTHWKHRVLFEGMPVLHHLSPRWFAIIPMLFILETIRRYHNELYVFEIDNVLRKGGRLALKSVTPRVKYLDIRSIECTQDIFGRMLDYGDLVLTTAGQERSNLVLAGVANPRRLMKLIDGLRTHVQRTAPPEVVRQASNE